MKIRFQPFVQLVRCGRYKMTQIVSSYTIRRYVYHLVNYLSKKVLHKPSQHSQAKYYYSSQAAHAKDEGSVYDLTLDEKNPYMSKENAIGLSNNLHHYCTTIVGILTGKVVTYCARSKTFPVYLYSAVRSINKRRANKKAMRILQDDSMQYVLRDSFK